MACTSFPVTVYTDDGPEYREEIDHDQPCTCRVPAKTAKDGKR